MLEQRADLKMVRFAVPTGDYAPIQKAKLYFGTVAIARLFARLCREVLHLCRGAARKYYSGHVITPVSKELTLYTAAA